MHKPLILLVLSCAVLSLALNNTTLKSIKKKKAFLVKKHLKRLKKVEGAIKLVGGRAEYEGNIEILHEGQWGAICDDEWDISEAFVICRQLGYPAGVGKPTVNSHFGSAKRKYWMDNVHCTGEEEDITNCRFDGWGANDCTPSEAAGVVCEQHEEKEVVVEEGGREKTESLTKMPKNLKVRLMQGRVPTEGRVEVKTEVGDWQVICGDGWSLLEAIVVCKQLSLGHAGAALQTDFFGSAASGPSVRCRGDEASLSDCLRGPCGGGGAAAAVSCAARMADLVPDGAELERTAHLEDRPLFFLQCAMEEDCLAAAAYEARREAAWHLETRRLLRFTARIVNVGTADFRPALPKEMWEWHMCHMHYHSMEVFATFDIYDSEGRRVAEGHKASFCLEDNQCLPGVKARYACANYGDQGISVNCSDIYKYTVDCQWVDVTDVKPGTYKLKVAVNPEFKVPEITFENNAAVCQFVYGETYGVVSNCTIERP